MKPTLHFTADRGWINDPNGTCFVDGIYHLCFQYHPKDAECGTMNWGHAESRDLIEWEQLDMAVTELPDADIFSGSAMRVDLENSEFFGQIAAIYTLHSAASEDLGISLSTDGKTFTPYADNPVVHGPVLPGKGKQHFRDPAFFRIPGENKVRIAVAEDTRVSFLESPDLIHWEKTGEFVDEKNAALGRYECPDLSMYESNGKTVWVLMVSRTVGIVTYYIGDFAGGRFVKQAGTDVKFRGGKCDYYAPITFNQTENEVVEIGWNGDWDYARITPVIDGKRGVLTIPKELFLTEQGGETVLGARFHHRLQEQFNAETAAFSPDQPALLTLTAAGACTCTLENAAGEKLLFGINADNELFIDRSASGNVDFAPTFRNVLKQKRLLTGAAVLYAVYDAGVLEVLCDDGTSFLAALVYPETPYDRLAVQGAELSCSRVK